MAVEAVRRGELGAVRFLYVRHADEVFRRAVDALGDEHAAEELTRCVFRDLPDQIGGFDAELMSLETWLLTLADDAAAAGVEAPGLVPVACLQPARLSA